jgi:hypothetical protein
MCALNHGLEAKSTSMCQPLQAAIGVYPSDEQLMLQAAQVSDAKTYAKITMLVDLVAGMVNAITSAIPSCQNTAAAGNPTSKSSYQTSSFVSDYNRILLAATGNLAGHGASHNNLVLHRHSKFIRLSTMALIHQR